MRTLIRVILVLGASATASSAIAQTGPSAPGAPPDAAATLRRLPVHFEPLPDGSLLGRHFTQSVRLSGAQIEIAPADKSHTPLRIGFAGARRGTIVEGVDLQPGRINDLLGSDRTKWRTGVRTYARARTQDV
jgi:hypothetical protein